jgi:hypothetical protein
MRALFVFTLVLLSSFDPLLACGPYYPQLETYRVQFINPQYFLESGYSGLAYTSNDLGDGPEAGVSANVEIWWNYCKQVPKKEDIRVVVSSAFYDFKWENPTNTFIKYLKDQNNQEAIDYIKFAYQCAPYNSISDPWEEGLKRDGDIFKYLETAKRLAGKTSNPDLKQRYAFLAVRLGYYAGAGGNPEEIYKTYFADRKEKNIIDYWAMSFVLKAISQNENEVIYNAAQIFYHAPDKRQLMRVRSYAYNIDLEKVLVYAKTAEEKAAVWLLAGLRNPAESLNLIKEIYKLTPNAAFLNFLLLYELNKLEDWIYTPYFKSFNNRATSYDADINAKSIKKDFDYARELLDFVNSVDLKLVANTYIWHTAKATLQMMIQDFTQAVISLKMAEKMAGKNEAAISQIRGLMMLCEINLKPVTGVNLPKRMQKRLMESIDNRYELELLFAVARTLEYQGNTTLAAMLFAKVNPKGIHYEEAMYWKTKNKLRYDYYDDYLSYVRMEYSPEALESLLNQLKQKPGKNAFSQWLYADLPQDIPKLFDILGTRYIQQNKLELALKSFELVPDSIWNAYPYKEYLDANPFYTNLFAHHRKTAADTIRYTKASLTRTLLEYIKKAEDPQNPDRAYHYFLIGSAYFNMTHYGNSWIMRRAFWTGQRDAQGLEDDEEFFGCKLAKSYFIKAAEATSTPRFKILCEAMAGRCTHIGLSWEYSGIPYGDDRAITENTFYINLKKDHPEEFSELMSNCYAFDTYLPSRKN